MRLFCLVRQYYAPPTTDNLGLMEQEVWAYAHLVLHFNLNYKNKNLGTILLASHMKIQTFFSWTHSFNSDKQSWCIPLAIQQRALSETRLHPGKDQAETNSSGKPLQPACSGRNHIKSHCEKGYSLWGMSSRRTF